MSIYDYNYPTYEVNNTNVWMIVSLVVAILGGIVLFFTFLSKQNENKFTGFLNWLYDFLSFKKMLLEPLLKIVYLIMAIYISLYSLSLIGSNFFTFLATFILGNVILRIVYEFSLVLLTICRNTTEINRKLTLVEKPKKTPKKVEQEEIKEEKIED